jgi:hypothetical protein
MPIIIWIICTFITYCTAVWMDFSDNKEKVSDCNSFHPILLALFFPLTWYFFGLFSLYMLGSYVVKKFDSKIKKINYNIGSFIDRGIKKIWKGR